MHAWGSPDCCCVCVCVFLSSSDISEHVEVWCCTLFSHLVARVQVASIVAGPCSLREGEASPESECLICSCTHDCLLVWTKRDVENTVLVA